MRRAALVAMLGLSLMAFGCKGNKSGGDESSGGEGEQVDDKGRCPRPEDDARTLESSAYDTSGDGRPDVRKVYLVFDADLDRRTVLICREADLNGDGIKDVARFYDDEGSPVREEADRNFDGNVDVVTLFDDGRVVRKELDENFDGRIETRLLYEDGRVMRIERDLAGRDPKVFRTDRWEYVEGGRVVRIGTDLDGDGKVDRWDRDTEVEHARRERERREAAEPAEDDDEAADEAVDEAASEEAAEDAEDEPSD